MAIIALAARMNSAAHRENILNTNLTNTDNRVYYITNEKITDSSGDLN